MADALITFVCIDLKSAKALPLEGELREKLEHGAITPQSDGVGEPAPGVLTMVHIAVPDKVHAPPSGKTITFNPVLLHRRHHRRFYSRQIMISPLARDCQAAQ